MIEVSNFFKEYFDLTDQSQIELSDGLIALFDSYVANRGHPLCGKDVPYHRPPNTVVTDVCLRHTHIEPTTPNSEEKKRWRESRTSDRCLVYVRSDCGRYFLIAYIHADAHEQARDYDHLRALAKIGQKWLLSNNLFADTSYPF